MGTTLQADLSFHVSRGSLFYWRLRTDEKEDLVALPADWLRPREIHQAALARDTAWQQRDDVDRTVDKRFARVTVRDLESLELLLVGTPFS